MRRAKRLLYIVLVTILLIVTAASPIYSQGPTHFPNCRLGISGAFNPSVGDYDIAQLNIGLYQDWLSRSNPAAEIGLPAQVTYLQTVRVHQNKVGDWTTPYVDPPAYTVSPSLVTIASQAASQPGSVWLIGNEIERRDWPTGKQDEITPELYATAFHEIQQTIKTADPTARVAIGGLIQATPLRLRYLDRVWDSYSAQFGYSMGEDIDVWNIHGFLLREVRGEWGADIPAGLEDYLPSDGFLYGASVQEAYDAQHDMAYFRQFLEDFRRWMADHGERNKPLLNTEYGILNDIGDSAEVIQFLTNTFDYMFTAADPDIGYPADENRLIQGWIWYSLNDNTSFFQYGTLFDAHKNLTDVGKGWENYVTNPGKPLASQPQPNLRVMNLQSTPELSPVKLQAGIANSGNTATSTANNILVRFWDGTLHQPGSKVIASRRLADIPGCGGYTAVEVEWLNRPASNATWYVEVVPVAGETKLVDNVASDTDRLLLYLPLVGKK